MRVPYRFSRKGVDGRPRGEPTTIVRLPIPIATIAKRRRRIVRFGDLNAFFSVEAREHLTVPLEGEPVPKAMD